MCFHVILDLKDQLVSLSDSPFIQTVYDNQRGLIAWMNQLLGATVEVLIQRLVQVSCVHKDREGLGTVLQGAIYRVLKAARGRQGFSRASFRDGYLKAVVLYRKNIADRAVVSEFRG